MGGPGGNNANLAASSLSSSESGGLSSIRSTSYFYDLKCQQEDAQSRIDITTKYLSAEIKRFKKCMIQDFNAVVIGFAQLQFQ